MMSRILHLNDIKDHTVRSLIFDEACPSKYVRCIYEMPSHSLVFVVVKSRNFLVYTFFQLNCILQYLTFAVRTSLCVINF